MNDDIRRAVRVELARRDLQQKDLADLTGLSPQHVSELLRGRSGNLAEGWEKIFKALHLKLTAVPDDQEHG
ncbi:MAG TPA: helix-turn-helix transcriptional regulator [Trueperaceae bacterium]